MTSIDADWSPLVFDALADAAGIEVELITLDTALRELGLSSMQLMELVYLLEEELAVLLVPDVLEDVVTVGDLIATAQREREEVDR